jgi:shikimate dehydrogenase
MALPRRRPFSAPTPIRDDEVDMSSITSVRGSTVLTGTIGDPIAHVRAPESMGQWFAERGIDAIWLPFHVHPEHLPAFMNGMRALENMAGVTVTMPHKRAVVDLVDAVSDCVRRTGVANMIRRQPGGRLVADNADGAGFVAGLHANKVVLTGRSIWLVGAGGAGTAIAWSIADEAPASIAITDTCQDAAELLADGLRSAYPAITFSTRVPAPRGVDVAINATPSGLHAGDPLSFDPALLRRDACVVEIIMKPAVTDLLRAAAAVGLKTVPGQAMLDGQLQIYADYLGLTPAPKAAKLNESKPNGSKLAVASAGR